MLAAPMAVTGRRTTEPLRGRASFTALPGIGNPENRKGWRHDDGHSQRRGPLRDRTQFLVDDLDAAVAYYRDRLGFAVDFTYEALYASVSRDGLPIHLKCAPKTVSDRAHRKEHEHLDAYVAVTGVEALYEELQSRGARITKPLAERPWACKDFYVEDTDGYILCFSEQIAERTRGRLGAMDLKDRVALVAGGTGTSRNDDRAALARARGRTSPSPTSSARTPRGRRARPSRRSGGARGAWRSIRRTPTAIPAPSRRRRRTSGRLDILVNNAGWNISIPFPDLETLDAAVWDRLFSTNLRGPYLLCRAAAPELKASGAGRIVNIASVAGLQPGGSSIGYATSKAGLIHLTRCLAVALAPEVSVNCVAPGLMDGTRMTSRLRPEVARGRPAARRPQPRGERRGRGRPGGRVLPIGQRHRPGPQHRRGRLLPLIRRRVAALTLPRRYACIVRP